MKGKMGIVILIKTDIAPKWDDMYVWKNRTLCEYTSMSNIPFILSEYWSLAM